MKNPGEGTSISLTEDGWSRAEILVSNAGYLGYTQTYKHDNSIKERYVGTKEGAVLQKLYSRNKYVSNLSSNTPLAEKENSNQKNISPSPPCPL